jgi:predicted phage terminase large subunit-like protein
LSTVNSATTKDKNSLTISPSDCEDLEKIEKQDCEDSFTQFVISSFHVITQDTDWVDNWHYDLICDEIQEAAMRVIKGEVRLHDLLFNLPPRTYKSKIITVCLNAWVWIHRPSLKFITCSMNPALAEEHAKCTRNLIESPWYQSKWGRRFKFTTDGRTSYDNDKGGKRYIASPRSYGALGFGADIIVFDDINDSVGVYREVERTAVLQFVNEKMPSRMDRPKIGLRIFQQQRLHQEDISGWIIKNAPTKFKRFCLPAEESDDVYPVELHKFYKKGLLFPARLDEAVLAEFKSTLRNAYFGQFQQTPLAAGGNVFKEAWFKWFTPDQIPEFDSILVSIDASFTDADSSCPASMQVWGRAMPNYYLLYDETEKMSAMTTGNRALAIAQQYPGCRVVVESAANGFFVIEFLKKSLSGVFGFDPRRYGGKEARADSITYLCEAGNVFLPDTNYIKSRWLPEILMFPNGQYKDRVDAMVQALIWFNRAEPRFGKRTNYNTY